MLFQGKVLLFHMLVEMMKPVISKHVSNSGSFNAVLEFLDAGPNGENIRLYNFQDRKEMQGVERGHFQHWIATF